MRFDDSIGYAWNSLARTYDKVAAWLGPGVSVLQAFPEMTGQPAYAPLCPASDRS
jgi:hypothetical protein